MLPGDDIYEQVNRGHKAVGQDAPVLLSRIPNKLVG
jgi:hypothetical protein